MAYEWLYNQSVQRNYSFSFINAQNWYRFTVGHYFHTLNDNWGYFLNLNLNFSIMLFDMDENAYFLTAAL